MSRVVRGLAEGRSTRLAALQAVARRGIAAHSRVAPVALCLAVVLLLGLTLHPRLLMLLPALVALVALGVGWPWLSVATLQARLRFADYRVHENDETRGELQSRQAAPWPAWGLVLELDGAALRPIEKLDPFAAVTRSFQLRPDRRGAFPRSATRISTGFPFGLCLARRRVQVERPLLVWPRVYPVAPPPDWAGTNADAGHVETRFAGPSGETIGARAYRRGDPMRWIHWPQTARHDSFIVREFPASGTPRARIVLDCRSSIHVGQGADSSFEWAVRIAASVAVGWLDAGAEVELSAARNHVTASGGRQQRVRILDFLAQVQTDDRFDASSLTNVRIPTILISTDDGWRDLGMSGNGALRGFALRVAGFGGEDLQLPFSAPGVVLVERPADVPFALLRVKGGLADAA